MKRGFALTLSMIVLIFFLTLILSVESQRIMIEEQTRANHAQMRAVASLLADMDSPALAYSVEKLAKRSLYDVNMKVIENKTFIKGSASDKICESFLEKYRGYLNSLAVRANDSGLILTYVEPDCILEQNDAFNLSLTTGTLITMRGRDIFITKSLHHSFNFSIQGIYDPYIAVNSYDPTLETPYNMVFVPIIKSKVKPDELDNGPSAITTSGYGRGWVYGEIITAGTAATLDKGEWGTKILLIDGNLPSTNPASLNNWKGNLTLFRGVILLKNNMASPTGPLNLNNLQGMDGNQPCTVNVTITTWNENTAPCIECGTYVKGRINSRSSPGCEPMLAGNAYISGNDYYLYQPTSIINDPTNLQERKTISTGVPFIVTSGASFSDNQRVLLNSEIESDLQRTYPPIHSGVHVYDIENQRAAALCANYFYYSGRGMNIFSRLEGKTRHNDEFGLESFVLGPVWATADKSKIDHEYFGNRAGHLVKGMPGCITPQICGLDLKYLPAGQIQISTDRDDDYGMDGVLYVKK